MAGDSRDGRSSSPRSLLSSGSESSPRAGRSSSPHALVAFEEATAGISQSQLAALARKDALLKRKESMIATKNRMAAQRSFLQAKMERGGEAAEEAEEAMAALDQMMQDVHTEEGGVGVRYDKDLDSDDEDKAEALERELQDVMKSIQPRSSARSRRSSLSQVYDGDEAMLALSHYQRREYEAATLVQRMWIRRTRNRRKHGAAATIQGCWRQWSARVSILEAAIERQASRQPVGVERMAYSVMGVESGARLAGGSAAGSSKPVNGAGSASGSHKSKYMCFLPGHPAWVAAAISAAACSCRAQVAARQPAKVRRGTMASPGSLSPRTLQSSPRSPQLGRERGQGAFLTAAASGASPKQSDKAARDTGDASRATLAGKGWKAVAHELMRQSGSVRDEDERGHEASVLPVRLAPTCVTIRGWDTTRIQRAEFDTEEGPSDEGRDFKQEELERRRASVTRKAASKRTGFAAFAVPSAGKSKSKRKRRRKKKRGRWQEADPFGGECPEVSRVAHQTGCQGHRAPTGGALQLERQLSAVRMRTLLRDMRLT